MSITEDLFSAVADFLARFITTLSCCLLRALSAAFCCMLSSGIRTVWFDRLSSVRRCSGGHLGSDLLVKFLDETVDPPNGELVFPDVSMKI
jgi:hypothetical protein